MLKKYVVALDQGTTSSRTVLFDKHGSIVGIKSKPLNQIYPKPGWVEHDPVEIYQGQLEVLREALKAFDVNPEEIAGIGIANQRETVIVWDKDTGEPVYNAIVWQCRRTADMCQYLKADGLSEVVREKTGLLIDAYFSGTKIKWILDNVPGAREKARDGKLLAGTVDCWLIWNLTGGKVHVTDYSNASRTMLFNIKTLNWDDELLNKLDIPKNILPQVVKSSEVIGETTEEILGVKVPIGGVAGDQQAALFGQACFEEGSAKNTYGTGCFILMNIGKKLSKPADKLLTTIAWDIGEGVEYALEGSIFNAGATVQWLVDELKLVQSPKEADMEAYSVPDTGGVYVVPAFTGLGAPYWDMFARGTIVGITRGTNKAHIVRATLESIAYQSKDVLEAMSAEAGISLKELNVDGGVSRSSFVMQFQADILRIPVNKPRVIETTALGAAYLAGLATGFWNSREEIRKNRELDRAFIPSADKELTDAMYNDWKRAVERSMNWIK